MSPVVGTEIAVPITTYGNAASWIAGIVLAILLGVGYRVVRRKESTWKDTTRVGITSSAALSVFVASMFAYDGKLPHLLSFILFVAMMVCALGVVLWALLKDWDSCRNGKLVAFVVITTILVAWTLGANFWLFTTAAASHPIFTSRIDNTLWWALWLDALFAGISVILGIEAERKHLSGQT